MAEEPRLFLRSGIFGVVIAIAYWWSTQEIAGTTLLGAFGMASLFMVGTLVRAWLRSGGYLDRRPARLLGLESLDDQERLIPEVTRFPTATLAPLIAGLGVALAALALAWGPGFLVVSVPFLALAAGSWYQAFTREYPADHESTSDPAGAAESRSVRDPESPGGG